MNSDGSKPEIADKLRLARYQRDLPAARRLFKDILERRNEVHLLRSATKNCNAIRTREALPYWSRILTQDAFELEAIYGYSSHLVRNGMNCANNGVFTDRTMDIAS